MPLPKIKNDPFSKEEHDELDRSVLDSSPSLLINDYSYAMLLMNIIQFSNGRVIPNTSEDWCLTRTREDQQLRDELRIALEKRSFCDIRTAELLHMQHPNFTPFTEKQEAGLRSALSSPFAGASVKALYGYLKENNRNFAKPLHYAKFCSIVQSSGTGKTRLMLELPHIDVLVIYLNIRGRDDTKGYPKRDEFPAAMLVEDNPSEDDYEGRCCHLLAAIFKLVANRLDPGDKEGEALTKWKSELKQWKVDICTIDSNARQDLLKDLQNTYEQVSRDSGSQQAAQKTMKKLYGELSPRLLAAAVPKDEHSPKLVIALDEAHGLRRRLRNGTLRSTIFLRSVAAYSKGPSRPSDSIWVLFASTTSKVGDFSSPQAHYPSDRVSQEGQLLFQPFSQTGWDSKAPKFRSVSASEVAKLEYIMNYGRPLWWSLDRSFDTDRVFDLAKEKLCGSLEYNPRDTRQSLSVLAQRFCLDVCFGHHEAVQFVETSVASNLRVCITTTSDRIWSHTTYPSEPFLSCASADLLHSNPGFFRAALQKLQEKVDGGMIEVGGVGELASRLLWLLAKDLFVRQKNPDWFRNAHDPQSEEADCRMISVTDFLGFVFGEQIWSSEGGEMAKKTFEGAKINFSHWVSMYGDVRQTTTIDGKVVVHEGQIPLDQWTARHWHRTSAVQCCHNQPLIDKVIPMFFDSPVAGQDDKAGIRRMSQILISDKARARMNRVALTSVKRTHDNIGGADSADSLPYIVILLDLGVANKQRVTMSFPQRVSPRTENDATCLRIHAVGLGPETYPFFGSSDSGQAVFETLHHLIEKHSIPSQQQTLAEKMQNQVRVGGLPNAEHMGWEDWTNPNYGVSDSTTSEPPPQSSDTVAGPSNTTQVVGIQQGQAVNMQAGSSKRNTVRHVPAESSQPVKCFIRSSISPTEQDDQKKRRTRNKPYK